MKKTDSMNHKWFLFSCLIILCFKSVGCSPKHSVQDTFNFKCQTAFVQPSNSGWVGLDKPEQDNNEEEGQEEGENVKSIEAVAQSFELSRTVHVENIVIGIRKNGEPNDFISIALHEDDSLSPKADPLEDSKKTYQLTELNKSEGYIKLELGNRVELKKKQRYWIVVNVRAQRIDEDYIELEGDDQDRYQKGYAVSSTDYTNPSWNAISSTSDLVFGVGCDDENLEKNKQG